MPSTHNVNFKGSVSEQAGTPTRAEPIVPATIVSGASGNSLKATPRPGVSRSFELPAAVSAKQIQQDSFRYGGGRSAGNRSLADNISRKIDQK
jgi:hypothetical protein